MTDQRGQMTVELACVLPVVIALILIVSNLMLYIVATARFDRVAAQAVLIHGMDLDPLATQTKIRDAIQTNFSNAIEIEVSHTTLDVLGRDTKSLSLIPNLVRYTCIMRMRPYPSVFSFAGVSVKTPVYLEHSTELVLDPYRSGVLG